MMNLSTARHDLMLLPLLRMSILLVVYLLGCLVLGNMLYFGGLIICCTPDYVLRSCCCGSIHTLDSWLLGNKIVVLSMRWF